LDGDTFCTLDLPEVTLPRRKRMKRGSDEPHRVIRVAAGLIFSQFTAPMEFQLLDSKTGEKWIRIVDVDRSKRTAIKLPIHQAGIQAINPTGSSRHGDWATVFAATQARKLFVV
jgi:hypothetical protein